MDFLERRPRVISVVALAAGLEVVTAFLLLVSPGLFVRVILGLELSAGGDAVGRLAGIALIGLALPCWPRASRRGEAVQPIFALLIFSVLCAVFLAFLGILGEAEGLLLWPAVATHAALAVLLSRAWLAACRA